MNKWKNSIIVNVVNILPSKGFKLKVHYKMFMKLKRSDMNQLLTSWKWSALSETYKIQMWWECKNFIKNIGLKENITAVYEEKDSIVMNVAKILLEDAIWKYT